MVGQSGRLEISATRLAHNVQLFRQRTAKATLCATVKADAYGHGINLILPALHAADVQWICVYSMDEALHAATLAPQMNVLVLAPVVGPLERDTIARLLESRIRISVNDLGTLERLSAMVPTGKIPLHVQVDTGLTRAGVAMADAAALVRRALELPGIQLEGIFSHLSHGDVAGHQSVENQAAALWKIAQPIKRERASILVHLQNSGGAWHLHADLDMARIGIGLYGLQPSMQDRIAGLLPVARVVAPILTIHEVPPGVGVGYGHLFTTPRPSRLAIVPVGYADGYPRALTGQGVVQLRGQTAPVVGRVSMDQIIVDVTDIPADIGDEVVVMSNDPAAPNSVDQIAQATGTIGYEIATGWGARLKRVLV